MKKLLLIFIAISLIGCEEKIINIDDLTIVDGTAYLRPDMSIFSGKVKGWHENGQLEREGKFKNGKADGLWKIWYENGQLEREGKYKNGKEEGLWKRWYENGQLEYEGNYKDGKGDGLWKRWHSNGQFWFERNY